MPTRPLSRSMETALLCYAGVPIPLWSAHTWTVATVRALLRRGYMKDGKVTRRGRARVRRILANRGTTLAELRALRRGA